MHKHAQLKADAEYGFSLPSAFKSHDSQLKQLIALSVFFASVCVMSIIGANMMWG